MKNRKFIIIVSILTIVSIISVGFTAWHFLTNGSISGYSSIVSSEVINTNDFIYYDTTKADGNAIECFDYYKNGFLNDDGSLNTSGTLSVYLIIDFDAGKNSFSQYDGINALINLQCINTKNSSYNIFESTSSKVSISYQCYAGNQATPFMQGTLNRDGLIVLAYSKQELNSETGSEEIKILYTFTVQSYDDFKNYLFPNLKNLVFTIETKIESI